MISQRAARVLWVFVVFTGLLLAAKFFVADVYRVDTPSMRPTIYAGPDRHSDTLEQEWVLVRYERRPSLERYDMVVWEPPGGGDAVVKRVAGMPGETVLLRDGDLLINGARLPPGVPRPAPIPVFDSAFLAITDFFNLTLAPEGPWTIEDDRTWSLDASEVAVGSNAGMMLFHPDLRDDHLHPDGRRIVGLRQVNDGVLEVGFLLEEALTEGACLRFQLIEEGDTFELRLEGVADGVEAKLVHFSVRSLKEPDSEPREVWRRAKIDLSPGRWYRLLFSNIDNHVGATLEDFALELGHDYAENEPYPSVRSGGKRSIGYRLGLGGEGVRARFRDLRIARDLYYTERGNYAIDGPLSLGPDEYFLLGDNSAVSQDSRELGAVQAQELIGRPRAVVWPWRRARWLDGASPGPR